MEPFDWGQVVALALGSGVTAGVVNNIAGGIRDKLNRSGAATAAEEERAAARQARREAAFEAVRPHSLKEAIRVRNWLEQEIWNLTETEDREPIEYQSPQPRCINAIEAEAALMTVAIRHPSSSVRKAARKLASDVSNASYAIIAHSHEAEHPGIEDYKGWRARVDTLIEDIHVPD